MADVTAAATAMGLPEALVERSANARAAASGSSVDDLLAAWAGGETAPAPAAPPPAAETGPEEPTADPEPTSAESAPPAAAAPEIVIDMPTAAPPPAPVPAGPYRPPVLVGAKDNPMTVFWGVVGLFFIVVMVGLVGPSIPIEAAGARSSDIPYSDAALEGQVLYGNLGCASCHTQMVRPVVADVGLGPVSLDDTNQVLGTTRYGPDLADVGFRITASQLEAIIGGLGSHPAQSLSEDDMSSLVAYLVESNTSLEAEVES